MNRDNSVSSDDSQRLLRTPLCQVLCSSSILEIWYLLRACHHSHYTDMETEAKRENTSPEVTQLVNVGTGN